MAFMRADSQIIKLIKMMPKSKATTLVAQVEEDLEAFTEVAELEDDDKVVVRRNSQKQYGDNLSYGYQNKISKLLFGGTLVIMVLTSIMYQVAMAYV
jgi:hypothetical protein